MGSTAVVRNRCTLDGQAVGYHIEHSIPVPHLLNATTDLNQAIDAVQQGLREMGEKLELFRPKEVAV